MLGKAEPSVTNPIARTPLQAHRLERLPLAVLPWSWRVLRNRSCRWGACLVLRVVKVPAGPRYRRRVRCSSRVRVVMTAFANLA